MCPGVSIRLNKYRSPVLLSLNIIDAVCALTVIPLSLSTASVSHTCPLLRCCSLIFPVSWRIASLNVLFPWSTCAITLKFRM